MDETDIHARLTAIEARLADISEALSKAPSRDALDEQIGGVLKAQLLLGALVESGQEAMRRQIADILPGAVAAELNARLEVEMTTLSTRLTTAIGEALGDQDRSMLLERAAERRPLDAILDMFDPPEGCQRDSNRPLT